MPLVLKYHFWPYPGMPPIAVLLRHEAVVEQVERPTIGKSDHLLGGLLGGMPCVGMRCPQVS